MKARTYYAGFILLTAPLAEEGVAVPAGSVPRFIVDKTLGDQTGTNPSLEEEEAKVVVDGLVERCAVSE